MAVEALGRGGGHSRDRPVAANLVDTLRAVTMRAASGLVLLGVLRSRLGWLQGLAARL